MAQSKILPSENLRKSKKLLDAFKRNPNAKTAAAEEEALPLLTWALVSGRSEDLILEILELAPQTARMISRQAIPNSHSSKLDLEPPSHPLAWALTYGASEKVISKILELAPQMAYVGQGGGSPLIIANVRSTTKYSIQAS